jgi:hypothetical protein
MNKFISYKEWLNEAVTPTVNRHMTHAEDLVLLGKDGLEWINKIFPKLYNKLKSDTDKDDIRLSVKFDGAPSVFVWTKFGNELPKPGVAIKGLFAKNPKVMFSGEDVDKYYIDQPDLAVKLKILLKYVVLLEIPEGEIWQGDFLFDKTTLKDEGNQYSFHPNTIIYKIDKDSEIGQKIGKSEIGIVWHTKYTGTSLENIKADYNVDVKRLKNPENVFMTDPYIASLAGYVTLTDDERKVIKEKLLKINKTSNTLIKSENYKKIISNEKLISLFNIYQNSLIRQNIRITDSEKFIEGFKTFIEKRYKKEIDSKKTDDAKVKYKAEMKNLISIIDENQDTFKTIVILMMIIRKLKNVFIKKLNNIGKFSTFLKTNKGKYIITGDEGFAVSDIHGNIVKLVDRYDFSYANFSPDIVKGWSK